LAKCRTGIGLPSKWDCFKMTMGWIADSHRRFESCFFKQAVNWILYADLTKKSTLRNYSDAKQI
jgi:hypothetical protein